MKKILNPLLVLAFSAPLHAEEIKIFIWEYFLSDTVLEQFTEKTGHTVKQYFYDNEVDRNSLITNGQASGYDLVLVDSATTRSYGEGGAFTPLSTTSIKNVENNSLQSLQACGEYGIPYSTGTMGIAHRSSVSKDKIDSWTQILSPPKEHVGTTMMLKDDTDTVAIALLSKGFDPFTNNTDELKLAYSELQNQSQYLLEYGYPISYADEKGADSDLTLAVIYAGDLFNLEELTGQDDWEYVVPREGTLLFVDCLTAPSGNTLKEATKEFLSYMGDPEVAYTNASDTWFLTTNEAALLLADDDYKNDSEIFPSSESLNNSFLYKEMSTEGLVIRNRIVSLLSVQK